MMLARSLHTSYRSRTLRSSRHNGSNLRRYLPLNSLHLKSIRSYSSDHNNNVEPFPDGKYKSLPRDLLPLIVHDPEGAVEEINMVEQIVMTDQEEFLAEVEGVRNNEEQLKATFKSLQEEFPETWGKQTYDGFVTALDQTTKGIKEQVEQSKYDLEGAGAWYDHDVEEEGNEGQIEGQEGQAKGQVQETPKPKQVATGQQKKGTAEDAKDYELNNDDEEEEGEYETFYAPAEFHEAFKKDPSIVDEDTAEVMREAEQILKEMEGESGRIHSLEAYNTPDYPDHLRGAFGTRDAPVIVPSFFPTRVVGCTGDSPNHEHDVLWHIVNETRPTICMECGQYFKLKKLDESVLDDEGSNTGEYQVDTIM